MLSIMKSLDPTKSHGADESSICMIQICSNSIVKPVMQIFENVFDGVFPDI